MIIIMAVGIVASVSYNYSVRTTTNELSQHVEGQMVSANHTFDMYFDYMESAFTRMAGNPNVRDDTGEDFNALVNYL